MDIICIGEMLIDFTPAKENGCYKANPGGAPANVAISTARNGLKGAFLGKMGNDDFGKMLLNTLEENKVEILCPKLTYEAVTTLAFVTLYEGGERSFTFARKPGADILLEKNDIKEEDIDRCRMVHCGSVSLSDNPSREAIIYAMAMANKKNKLVSFDINYREMIWEINKAKEQCERIYEYVDLLKISEEELDFVGGEDNIEEFIKKYNIKVLVETLGKDGAKYFYYDKKSQKIYSDIIKGKKVNAVDATGAGDAFWGGFLSSLLMNEISNADDITQEMADGALKYANASGALCVQKMGGIPALPYKEDIIKMLNE